jgi:MFS transporter, ACS family, D-galactonate transporter
MQRGFLHIDEASPNIAKNHLQIPAPQSMMRKRIVPTSPHVTQRTGIPARLKIALAHLAISAFINFIDRGNLSIAAPLLKDELALSPSKLGLLLSGFFWTYSCAQLLAGWLVDRLNVNWVFAAGFVLWSAATALTGLTHTFAMLFALRLLLGLGESVAFPSYSKIIALNFTEEHRGSANSVLTAGLLLGPGFGMLFGGLLMARYGWRSFFTVLGAVSITWVFTWIVWMPEKARATPENNSLKIGFFDLVRLRSAWGTCVGLFSYNYVSYFLITWLPYYLVHDRSFSMTHMAKLGGLAYLLGACFAILSGRLSDMWIADGATPTLVRKTFTGGGLALAGILLGLVATVNTAYLPIALIVGVIIFAASGSNVWAVTQTLAGPKATGRWVGFQNFGGNFSGIAAPWLTGLVLEKTGHFYWAFAIMSGVALAGAASWIFLIGEVVPVKWDALREEQVTGHTLPSTFARG